MKMVIYVFTKSYSTSLGIDLIPMGIEGIEVPTKEDAINILKQDDTINILLSENFEPDFLKTVKEINPGLHVFLVANQTMRPSDIIALHKHGVEAVIAYMENTSAMADEIVKSIITNNIRTSEKRFHIRVQPKEYEDVRAAIFIKNVGKFVRGRILDISAGGLAMRLNDSLEASLLTPKTVYDPLLISIQGNEVKTLSYLIAKRADAAGFKFDNVEANDMKKIATYIHNKVTENSKNLMSQIIS